MAVRRGVPRASTPIAAVALRWLSALAALAGIAWSATVLRREGFTDPSARIAEALLSGGSFAATRSLEGFADADLATAAASCDAGALRAILVLRAARVERAASSVEDLDAGDDGVLRMEEAARALLACAPHQAIGWLALYSARITRTGLDDEALRYLARCYTLAPREAWIAIRRNPLAVRAFDHLPEGLRDQVVAEFADLAQAGFAASMAEIMVSAGPAARARLVERSADLDDPSRERLLRELKAREPGFTPPPDRPWR